ncbi:MAG: polysaccharide deacetylase family protein [Hyphomicrobium sp.]|nr:polysaccharide deacetylase family protein [Hyphomicrobium sp.]
MRRALAAVVEMVIFALASGLLAQAAWAAASVDACATRTDMLGISRVIEVDTTGGPMFGRSPQGAFDVLDDHEVILTFDDGPLRPYTAKVLEALDAHCTKATFFMVGRMAVADPAMVKEVAKHGHTIGTHTWSHAKLQTVGLNEARGEIELGFSAVVKALGKPIAPFFRFPYLRMSDTAIGYLKSRNVASFYIDIDSRDFDTRDGATVERRVLAQLAKRGKGILLFHDIQPSTAQALKGILNKLKMRGYKVVHMVPKTNATTLANFDKLASRKIEQRKRATENQQLTKHSVVSPATGGTSANGKREVLPWGKKPDPTASRRKARAKRTSNNSWYSWFGAW